MWDKIKTWIEVNERPLPTYSTMIFILAIMLGLLGDNVNTIMAAGLMAVITLLYRLLEYAVNIHRLLTIMNNSPRNVKIVAANLVVERGKDGNA